MCIYIIYIHAKLKGSIYLAQKYHCDILTDQFTQNTTNKTWKWTTLIKWAIACCHTLLLVGKNRSLLYWASLFWKHLSCHNGKNVDKVVSLLLDSYSATLRFQCLNNIKMQIRSRSQGGKSKLNYIGFKTYIIKWWIHTRVQNLKLTSLIILFIQSEASLNAVPMTQRRMTAQEICYQRMQKAQQQAAQLAAAVKTASASTNPILGLSGEKRRVAHRPTASLPSSKPGMKGSYI